jgi:hypothetical protein
LRMNPLSPFLFMVKQEILNPLQIRPLRADRLILSPRGPLNLCPVR